VRGLKGTSAGALKSQKHISAFHPGLDNRQLDEDHTQLMKSASHHDFPTFSNKPAAQGLALDSEGSNTGNVTSLLPLDVCSCVLEAVLSDMSQSKGQGSMLPRCVEADVVVEPGSC